MVSVALEPYWTSLFTQPWCLIAKQSLLESSAPVSALLSADAWKSLFDTFHRGLAARQGCGCSSAFPAHGITLYKGSLPWQGTGDNCAMCRHWPRQGFERETSRGWVWDGASRCSYAPDQWEVYRSPETFHEFRFYLGKMAIMKINQKQGKPIWKHWFSYTLAVASVVHFFNTYSKWHLISRLIPFFFQNMKGNLAFKLTFQPKVMFFPLLSFTENTGTPLITVSPQMIILLHFANSAKKSPIIQLLCLSTSHRRAEAAPLSPSLLPSRLSPLRGSPSLDFGGIPVEIPDRRWRRFLAALPWTCHDHSHWYLTKNPGLCMEMFGLALYLECFLSSKIIAFTKTIGVFMWREHGDVSRS